MSLEGAKAAMIDQMRSLLFECLPDHVKTMFNGAEFIDATDQSLTVTFPDNPARYEYAKQQEIPLTAYLSYKRRKPFELYVR